MTKIATTNIVQQRYVVLTHEEALAVRHHLGKAERSERWHLIGLDSAVKKLDAYAGKRATM